MKSIEVRGLSKRYGTQHVLNGVNLTACAGETVVVLGKSGSGKSVLLRHLIGLEIPDDGEIYIENTLITGRHSKLHHVLPRMGMLFQSGALFDSMTVGENIALYLRSHPDLIEHHFLSEHAIQNRIRESLHLVGLEHAEHLMPSTLSGGMKKRAALARLIAYRPSILFYDEPTTGLDPSTAMQINELICSIQNTLHATSIVVTHDLCSTMRIADTIAFIENGVIIQIAPKEEFVRLKHPDIQEFLHHAIPKGLV